MKNIVKTAGIIALVAVIGLAFTACTKSSGSGGGGKSLNSAEALKEYLDSQPANSPDKPIKVSMSVNDMLIKNVWEVIRNAGKYVSLDLSKSVGLTEISSSNDLSAGKALVNIIIPNSVTSIGDHAFWKCTSLASVTIPNSVTSIGDLAFRKCTSLTSVTIPNSVTSIGSNAFMECTSLTSVTIPNSVTSIGSKAFMECTSLASVTIPNSVTSITAGTFWECTSLASVTFQGTIKYFAEGGWVGRYEPDPPFYGDLRNKYLAGGIGTYTTTAPVGENSKWTKQ